MSNNEAKVIQASEVIKMINDGFIEAFYWGTPSKEQAYRLRNAANNAISRADLGDTYCCRLYPTLNSKTEITYIVEVIKK